MVSWWLALALLAPDNLAFNGDCELPAPTGPPPGWAMWGAQEFKDPANYTRDATVQHSGAASLRVHQPAGTGGYLVVDPAHALRPALNQRYHVVFWARAEREGIAGASFTAYRSIAPFVDAPAPGAWALAVGPDWRRFEFVITEGQDFFADASPYLLLTLKPGADAQTARTLWVDDLEVTATDLAADEVALRLTDPASFDLPPLDHGVAPGEALSVQADFAAVAGPAQPDVAGVSFHRLVGWTGQPYDRAGNYTLDPRVETAIRDLHLPITRFYGVADEPFEIEAALDRLADLCQRAGLPAARVVLELEDQSSNRRVDSAIWARAAAHSEARGYGFHRWEVGNEVYSAMWAPGEQGLAYASPEAYVAQVRAVSDAVRAVQPGALVGLSIHPQSLGWGNRVLRLAAGAYDFICPHLYSFRRMDTAVPEQVVIDDNQDSIDLARRLLALARLYNPGRDIVIDDTEWGLHGFDGSGARADDVARNAGILGVLHRAVRMIYYARLDGIRGASGWQMLSNPASPGFGILSQMVPDQRFMLYWLHYYANRAILPQAVATRGTAPQRAGAPLTPLLVTRAADNSRAALIWVNAGPTAIPARFSWSGAVFGRVEATTLAQTDIDAPPLLADKADLVRELAVDLAPGELRADLPARSVSFVWLSR